MGDLEKAIAGLRIILDQNTVRVSLGELSPLQIKIIDMLIGPLSLGVRLERARCSLVVKTPPWRAGHR